MILCPIQRAWMNCPPDKFIRVPSDQLCNFAATCLRTAGLRANHAEQVAGLLTNADLRGVRSHGTRQLNPYCQHLREKVINPTPDLKVIKETDNTVLIDGDGGLGYTPMMMATELALTKAAEKGIAVGATCHIGHYGAAGHYVRRAMEKGYTAMSVQGLPSFISKTNPNNRPQSAYWGNRALCFGLPGRDEPPLILDVATRILGDDQIGGEFDYMQELIPAAFFKSMGYTGVAWALGGVFVGVDNPQAVEVTKKWPEAYLGGLILIMDIGLFTEPSQFRSGIDSLVRGVRENMEPVRGYDEATLPGTVEFHREQEYKRDGVPLGLDDIELLKRTAEETGVQIPKVFFFENTKG